MFITAYRKLGSLRRWDNFFAWLYSITSNLCKNFLRAKSRRPDSEFIEDQEPEILDAPALDAYQEGLTYQPLHDALEALPEMQRQVLTLYYLAGMNTREIAEFLGTAHDTVRQRLSRARTQLKEEVLTMISTTFETHKLQPGFTLRIVETIKQTKIQSPPTKASLPFGVSAAAGLIVLLFSLTIPHSPLYPIGQLIGSALPSQTQVPEVGVIPVDTVEITEITYLSGERAETDFGRKPDPEPIPAFGLGEWTEKTDMPQIRNWLGTSAADGKIYAIGGFVQGKISPSGVAYDTEADVWAALADMPTQRCCFSITAVDGKIYAIGGSPIFDAVTAAVEVYDPATNTWEKRADMLTARFGLSTAAVNGKIYAIGGGAGPGLLLQTVEEYDPVADAWAPKEDMPTARAWLANAAPAVNGKIYVIGGWIDAEQGVDFSIATVEEYDPVADTWTPKADMPTPRGALALTTVNGKIYAIGGQAQLLGPSLKTVEVYDPAKDLWTGDKDMLTARGSHSVSTVNGSIYAIGGWNPGAGTLATVEAYDTGFRPTSVNPAGKLPTMWGEVKVEK